MKAILRLTLSGNCDVIKILNNATQDSIYRTVALCEQENNESCLEKNIDFIFDPIMDNIFDYVKKENLFFNMAKLAEKKIKYYVNDLMFFDKIAIYTAVTDINFYWVVNEHYTRLFFVNDDFKMSVLDYYINDPRCDIYYIESCLDDNLTIVPFRN